ncbi:MAG TPA: hypothetical protein VK796_12475 [Cytophaga sp.]|nr:hypothetical protein [Cytophaga sp.]
MKNLQKNSFVFSCCESNNIFSHIEITRSINRARFRLKKIKRKFKFPFNNSTNLDPANPEPISDRRKDANVFDQYQENIQMGKIKLVQVSMCGIVLVIINLIVIFYS